MSNSISKIGLKQAFLVVEDKVYYRRRRITQLRLGGYSNKKIAERIYQKLMGQIAEGKWFERLPGEDKTFRELMEKYMREHSARNKAPIS